MVQLAPALSGYYQGFSRTLNRAREDIMKLHKIFAGLDCAAAVATISTSSLEAAPKKKTAPDQQANPALAGPEKKYPTGSSYELKSINGKPVPSDVLVTFQVDSAFRGAGSAGCNTWSATVYPVRNQRLAVGPIALTRKECDKDRMAIEHAFTSFLHASPFWDTNGSELTLKLPNGEMKLQRSL
jgi:heat shock protein HslJ